MSTSITKGSPSGWFFRKSARVTLVVAVIGCLLVGPTLAQVHRHDSFMANGSWQFSNFGTSRMSGDTFREAFDLNFFDYLNPITPIMYLAGRGMADGGNCFGMSLLASAGEHSSGGNLRAPFTGTLREDFWSNYPARSGDLDLDINTYHWRQLSTHFVTRWLVGLAESPERVADRIADDIGEGRYGVLCINSGGNGHALVPLAVTRTSENIDVVVYDCNLPLDEIRGNTLVINRSAGTWRYHRSWSSSAGWHNTWTGGTTGISYVSFSNSAGWRNLLNDPVDLILVFGEGTTVEQITDEKGRALYRRASGRGLEDVNFTARGLGREIVPFIPMAQAPARDKQRIRSIRPTQARRVDTTLAKMHNDMVERFAADYGDESQVFFVRNPNLLLNVDLVAQAKAKDARMTVGNSSGTVEVVFQPERRGDVIRARATLNLKSPPSNIAMQSRSKASLKADVIINEVDRSKQELQVAKAIDLPLRGTSPITLSRSSRGDFRVLGKDLRGQTTIQREAIGRDARVRPLPSTTVQLGPQPEPPDRKKR